MEELVTIMRSILEEIKDLNSKIDDVMGYGTYNNISDVCSKLDEIKEGIEEIKGYGGNYSDLGDISRKLDGVKESVEELKGDGICNNISDICEKLDNLETAIVSGSNY